VLYVCPVQYLRYLRSWPVALACVIVLSAALLLPGLGAFGLWEPQERQLADRVAPRTELAQVRTTPQIAKPLDAVATPPNPCLRQAPDDARARTLTPKAIAWGRDHIADSDAGRRMPLALLGFLTVLATAGIAMRIAGARAGILTSFVMLAMPLLVFQSRQLNSEIGTAAGAALTLYGLVTFAGRLSLIGLVESTVAIASLAAGLTIGFWSGGALLGVLVPVGAYAAAVGMIWPLVFTGTRAALRRIRPAWEKHVPQTEEPLAGQIKGALATLVVFAVIGVLIYQTFKVVEPQPGLVPPQRALFGKAFMPSGCWSTALGGTWRVDDDLRYIFDSTFEQIAYGTFPWGILAPIAMASLLASVRREHRVIGALTLAWGGAAWVAAEVFQRKVGFTLYAGFPALALAVGVWLDGVFKSRLEYEEPVLPRMSLLIGSFTVLGVIVLGKDMHSFAEKVTSLIIGGTDVPYPAMSKTLWLPTKAWALILGAYTAGAFALTMATWRETPGVVVVPPIPRVKSAVVAVASAALYPIAIPVLLLRRWNDDRDRKQRDVAQLTALAAILGTIVTAAFWSFVWQPKIAQHVSSRGLFDTYLSLRKAGDQLVIMGDMGDAPHDYAPDATPEIVSSRDQIVASIGRPNRVFAIAPQTELCQLHREIGGKPYYVIDDRNLKSLLLSNRVDGTTDKNPLARAIVHEEPKNIPIRVPNDAKGQPQHIIFDDAIELIGWDLPKSVGRGSKFQGRLYYKIKKQVGANWTVILHFDGSYGRAGNGDHKPINDRCPTSTWQPGDYIIDTFTVPGIGGAYPAGEYGVYTGFFTGTAPNYKNMHVTSAPAGMLDEKTDRVKITTISLD
jgi:hypothetical protein